MLAVRLIPHLLVLAALLALLGSAAAAQQTPPADTTALPAAPPAPLPPAEAASGEGLEHPVTFAARDSLVLVFAEADDPDGDVATLFGEARAAYDDATLGAYAIDVLFGREELRARGAESDSGFVGRPQFQQGSDSFTGRELAFNLATSRGRVVGARTVVEDGYLLGGIVKQAGPRVTFAQDAVYTTCEYEDHPHYGLRAGRMKIVDGEWVYTGPAQLYILGIPTPLWLPFGFFPAAEGRRSGPLPPTYGEQGDLGFYLQNLGWYWAMSDYMDLQVSGDIYTSGSFRVSPLFRYARRYHYSGNLRFAYGRLRRGESQDPSFAVEQNAQLQWTHSQQLDAANTARLSADVNLASRGYLRAFSQDFDDRVTQTTTSSIAFNKSWRRSGRALSMNLRQSQNLTTGRADLTLPTLSFSQQTRYPFRRTGRPGQRWYEQIGYSYSGNLRNTYSFAPDTSRPGAEDISWIEGLFSYDDYFAATGNRERFDFQASHSIPVSASFSFNRFPLTGTPFRLNLTPNLSYTEDWYTRRQRVLTDDDGTALYDSTGRIIETTEQAFTPIRRLTAGVSANTEFFGTFPWRIGSLDGFRHVVRPTASFSYGPDYSSDFWGYYRTYRDSTGVEQQYAIVEGLSLAQRATRSLTFSVNNTLLTRIARTDTTGEVQRRPLQLLTLDLSSGYDFAADSLRFRQVNLTARTRVGEALNLNLSASYSPYDYDRATGREIATYYLARRGRPLRFTRLNFTATTSLRGGRNGGAELAAPQRVRPLFPELDDLSDDGLVPYDYRRRDLGYVSFATPWSLSLDFNYNLNRSFRSGTDNTRAATLGATFDFSLTRNWKIAGRTGYDFERGELTTTSLSILRDLHCWEMSFSWIPIGTYRSFGFSIYVKSGFLRDLLRLDVPRQDVRDPFGLAGGRSRF